MVVKGPKKFLKLLLHIKHFTFLQYTIIFIDIVHLFCPIFSDAVTNNHEKDKTCFGNFVIIKMSKETPALTGLLQLGQHTNITP